MARNQSKVLMLPSGSMVWCEDVAGILVLGRPATTPRDPTEDLLPALVVRSPSGDTNYVPLRGPDLSMVDPVSMLKRHLPDQGEAELVVERFGVETHKGLVVPKFYELKEED
jgi:hypothetical protein